MELARRFSVGTVSVPTYAVVSGISRVRAPWSLAAPATAAAAGPRAIAVQAERLAGREGRAHLSIHQGLASRLGGGRGS